MKKLGLLSLVMILILVMMNVKTSAAGSIPLVDYQGQYVKYRNSNVNVMMPTEYEQQERYFRAVWVTPLAGNISRFSSEASYRREILEMFDVMEYYNLNAVIFHVRIMNDALYHSELNPTSNYLNTTWDALSWVIEEAHKRGIEFHAWMNPYRVKSSGGTTPEAEAAAIKNVAPRNIGADPANLLVVNGGGVILNPGLEVVRNFLVETVVELMDNYDVDAIHFDDYFYINNVDDSATYNSNNPNGLNLSDWRREQVNAFIQDLGTAMTLYNEENNRYVQLGISPTGIYRNGNGIVTYDSDGTAITNGSNTAGQEHYQSYLFSDTKKWIDNEWIDYIVPQSYWGFTHPVAGYADVIDWWDKVVKNKNVNLYSGMGIYMSGQPGSNYSWGRDANESYNQILYASSLENVLGTVFYNYQYLKTAYNGDTTSLYGQGLARIKGELFTSPSLLPTLQRFEEVKLPDVTNFTVSEGATGNVLQFDAVEEAKQYAIYRTKEAFTFGNDQLIAILGTSAGERITFTDDTSDEYNYAVRTVSRTNTLSDGARKYNQEFSVEFYDHNNNLIATKTATYGESVTAPTYSAPIGKEFVGWSIDLSYITGDCKAYPRFTDSEFTINYYDDEKNIIKTEKVSYMQSGTPPTVTKEGHTFKGWTVSVAAVTADIDTYPIFEVNIYTVTFLNKDGNVISSQQVLYGRDAIAPLVEPIEGFNFKEWDADFTNVTSDIEVKPVYAPLTYTVTFVLESDPTVIIDVQTVERNADAVEPLDKLPVVPGKEFVRWIGSFTGVIMDMTVRARYDYAMYYVIYYDYDGEEYIVYEAFYLDELEVPEPPVKEGYTFIRWDTILTPEDITKDYDIHPIYDYVPVLKEYVVTYYDDLGNSLGNETVLEGQDAKFPYQAPAKEGYTFSSWDKDGKAINADTSITTQYVINKYTVTYVGFNNEVITTEVVEYLGTASLNVTAPDVDGYKFIDYDYSGEAIKSDITITLQYEKVSNKLFNCDNGTIVVMMGVILTMFTIRFIVFKRRMW